ncbi:NifU family protein [Verrucomicrobiota bacterium sgz303538]
MNRLGERLQELVEEAATLPDPSSRELLQECMETVLAFYGRGLERVLQLATETDGEERKLYDRMIDDSILRGLLLIHGLHPDDLSTRLQQALSKIRPYMESHGGDVEILSLDDGVAKLRLRGSCESCPSSTVTMELAVRHAIEEACPDLLGFEVEGANSPPASAVPRRTNSEWFLIDEAPNLQEGGLLPVHAAGVPLIICKVGDMFYAYGDRCRACNLPLHLGALSGDVLSCPSGHRYDVRRAGCGIEKPNLHLEPFPLLVNDGEVRVAIKLVEPLEL